MLFWRKYPFSGSDPSHGLAPSDKLFVVIGVGQDGSYLLFRTTSQGRSDRPENDGCHSDASVFRFNNNLGRFDKPTWVQFEHNYIHEEREITNAGARVIFTLASDDIQAIINCFRRSPELCNWLQPYCS